MITIIVLWHIIKKKEILIECSENRCEILSTEKKEWMNKYIKQKNITDTELENLKKERREFVSKCNSKLAELQIRESDVEKKEENFASKQSEMERLYRYKEESITRTYLKFEEDCTVKLLEMSEAMKSKSPFSHVAEMISDFKMAVYDDAEKYLRNKRRSAPTAADTIKEIREKTRNILFQFKQIKYKYTFLLDVFPELKNYVEDEESLNHLSDFKDYKGFNEGYDRVRMWLSDEEYKSLSETQRNQLALDRYKARTNKTNWEVGMEYELYIGYMLKQKGFTIQQYGIENGLHDLGRDIIAEKSRLNGERIIYIIQCKRWAENKELHENVICQLYGTAIEYELKNRHFINTKVVPLLVTTARISDMARKFAEKLGVIIKTEVKIGDYPMIKCNRDSMIYHLPFDQQYYTTIINEAQGEFYAWTVEEAVNAGYRRAKRWNNN